MPDRDVLPRGASIVYDSGRQGDGDQRVTPAEEIEYLKERVRQLEDALCMTFQAPVRLGLTRTEGQILGLIYQRAEVTYDQVYTAVYGGRRNPPEPQIVNVFVCRLRAKLRSRGIAIKTKWGEGVYMDVESKAKLREYLANDRIAA